MNNRTVRKFTSEGNACFKELVIKKPSNLLARLEALLEDPKLTISVGHDHDFNWIEQRFGLAQELWELFGEDKALEDQVGDILLWNWISSAYLIELLSKSGVDDENLQGILGKQFERWVLTESILRYHRHLISGPFFAYAANFPHTERAMCQLATPVLSPGELVERIAGKRQFASGVVCYLATLLYYDQKTDKLRPGITSAMGSPKRFSAYFTQIDRTIDYEGMTVEQLLEMLPKNFGEWIKMAKLDLATAKQNPTFTT